jgi:hypothetical protein
MPVYTFLRDPEAYAPRDADAGCGVRGIVMFEILAAALAPTVAKILLKEYFGDTTAELGGTLTDVATKWVKDRAEQRRAVRLVEELGIRSSIG